MAPSLLNNPFQEIVDKSRASQNKVELARLLLLLQEAGPMHHILEVGVHKGYSLEVWNAAFNPTKLIGIENDPHEVDWEIISDPVQIVKEDSHSERTLEIVKLLLAGLTVDFLFLDGDHTYEGVKKDYELYSPLVRKGGIIAFHDVMLTDVKYQQAGVDVNRFWVELNEPAGTKSYVLWDEIGQGTGTGVLYVKK